MTPPLWIDERGRPRPTRSCPRCQRDIPINRWPTRTLRTQGWRPYGLPDVGLMVRPPQEVVLVPEGDGWYSEIPVLGWPGRAIASPRALNGTNVSVPEQRGES